MKEIVIDTNYPNYSYNETEKYFYILNKFNTIEGSINYILSDLDCTRLTKDGKRICTTNSFMYDNYVYLYIRFLLRIKDYALYNKYYELLLSIHNNNLKFEETFIEKPVVKNNKKTKTKKQKVDNKFIRKITYDLFTNEPHYIYFNPKTSEEINSDNPDLLEELNNKKKNVRKVSKMVSVPTGIIFNFNKQKE